MHTIVITGASRGIGRALAEKYLANGDLVIGTSRDGSAAFAHENLLMVPMELADEKSREACVRSIIATGKPIDVLVNNAWVFHDKDVTEAVDATVLRETLETNLYGTIDLTERLVPSMNRNGHIVNVSSRRGSMAYTEEKSPHPCYGIAKAALNMFTRVLAARLKGDVTVSAVHPGFVQTDMNDGEGDISPQEAAEDMLRVIDGQVETGQFWFKGERYPW